MHQVIEDSDYYDLNVISKRQWEGIVTLSQTANPLCKDIITEAIPWWLDVLKNMKCLQSVDCELSAYCYHLDPWHTIRSGSLYYRSLFKTPYSDEYFM